MIVSRSLAAGYLAWGIVPAVLAAGMLASRPITPAAVAVACFVVAWVAAGVALLRRDRRAPAAALLVLLVPWGLALAQTLRRVAFVVREGRMEAVDGSGSPMAFLLGVATEQVAVFLPLTVLGVLLLRARRVQPTEALRPDA